MSIRADDAEYAYPTSGGCATLSIDGAPLATSVDYPIGYWYDDGCESWWEISDYTVIDISATTPNLTDGAHTASVAVRNSGSLTTQTAWPFTVAAGPRVVSFSPTPNSIVSGLRPTIGFTATDNSPGPLTLQLSIDGSSAVTQVATQGAWSWRPAWNLTDDATHTCQIVVTDGAGNATTSSWSFRAEQYAPMPNPGGCSTCHAGYPVPNHPTSNCNACHGSSNCVDCHGYHGPEYLDPGCSCHGAAPHGEMEAVHSAPMDNECRACHTSVLTREHLRWPPGASGSYTCLTCHASGSNAVTSAIAAGDTRCVACHGTSANHLAAHEGATLTKPSCATCHVSNLEQEHVRDRAIACRACHGRDVAALPKAGSAGLGPFTALAAGPSVLGGFSKPGASPTGGGFSTLDASSWGCGSCHDPLPHGTTETCNPCHGEHELTTDGSEPTAALAYYSEWTTVGPNGDVATPHKGYQLTTTKCAVCHSVHRGLPGGQVLLRSTVEGACEYCHVASSIGGVVVYAGSVDAYWDFVGQGAHNRTSESSCNSCHSVHGAHTLEGAVSVKILRDWATDGSGRSYSPQVLARWPDPAAGTVRDEQVTAFCTGCHKYYVESYETTVTPLAFDHHDSYSFVETDPVKTHVMTSSIDSYDNPNASQTGSQVAFAGSGTCRSCHDAGETDHGPGISESSFPHYTRDYYRFMSTGSSFESSGSMNTTESVDGLCLKCHLTSTSGVGLTY